jgi:hypothetical protein
MGAMMGMGGTCTACGGSGQACCGGGLILGGALGTCEMGFECMAPAGGRDAGGGSASCEPCGAAGQACCGLGGGFGGGTCTGTLRCTAPDGGGARTCQ